MGARVKLVGLAAVVLATIGCGGAPANSGGTATGSPYIVGFEGGLTGQAASLVVSLYDGVNGYAYYINHHGGIGNHPIQVVARDDGGYNTPKITANFDEFRDSIKPSVVFGWNYGPAAEVVGPMAQQAQLPLILDAPVSKYTSYLYAADTNYVQEADVEVQLAKAFVKTGKVPRVALFAATVPSTTAYRAEVTKLVEQNGWSLVYDSALPVPAPDDMSPQANKVVSSNVDIVLGALFDPIPAELMRSLGQLSWKGIVINYRAGSAETDLQVINNPNFYAIRSVKYGTDPSVKAMANAVTAAGGHPAGDAVGIGWTSGAIIAAALGKCGYPCSGPAMQKALDQLSQVGTDGVTFGPVGYTANDHSSIRSIQFYHWVNGKPQAYAQPIPLTLRTAVTP